MVAPPPPSPLGPLAGPVRLVAGVLVLAYIGTFLADRFLGTSWRRSLTGAIRSGFGWFNRYHRRGSWIAGGVAWLVLFASGTWGTILALLVAVYVALRALTVGVLGPIALYAERSVRGRIAAAGDYALPMAVSEHRGVGWRERWGGVVSVPSRGSIAALGASTSGKTSACEHVVGPMVDEIEARETGTPIVLYDHKDDYREHLATHHPDRPVVRLSSEGSTHTWSVFAEMDAAERRGEDPDRMADRIAHALFSETETGSGGSSRYFARASRQVFAAVLKYIHRDARATDRTPGNGVLVRFFQSRSAEDAADALASHDDLKPATTHLVGDGQQAGVWSSVQLEIADTFAGDLASDPTDDRPAFSVLDYMHAPRGRALLLDYQGVEASKRVFTTLVTLASRPAIDDGTGGRFVLDEIEKLNHKIPTLEELVNVGSQRDVRVLITLQSVAQLRAVYGSERATSLLAGFLTTLIMRVNDADSVEFAKGRIGADRVERTSHVDRKTIAGKQVETGRETRLEDEDVFGDRELQSFPVGTGVLVRSDSLAAGYIDRFDGGTSSPSPSSSEAAAAPETPPSENASTASGDD